MGMGGQTVGKRTHRGSDTQGTKKKKKREIDDDKKRRRSKRATENSNDRGKKPSKEGNCRWKSFPKVSLYV